MNNINNNRDVKKAELEREKVIKEVNDMIADILINQIEDLPITKDAKESILDQLIMQL